MQGVRLSGDLRGLMFEACVEQCFCNLSDKNVEVVYSFPLPWGAVLLGVDVLLGSRRFTGAVVEKKQAEARYEEAILEGNVVIMLEKNHDHSYSLNLGNLAARERCVITLRYAQTLQFEQRGLRLLIPTVIAPRYGDVLQDGRLMPHQALGHSLMASYPFELELRLHGGLAQSRVASPSHLVNVAHGGFETGNVLTVTLAQQESLERDFVLVVDQLACDSTAIAARDSVEPESVAILASFCPRIRAQGATSTAIKILVDCSSSMAGDSMDAAKRALNAIVLQLGVGDRFSLSRFGSTVEHRFRDLWKAMEATKQAAQRWIAGLKADLGGTEMEAALLSTFALAKTVSSDVLVVTDGEISAIERTLESAKASGHRLFVVGIGSSPAETHLRRLAEATGGACDFVVPGEAVEPAVLRMFARLRSPRLTGLSLHWPEGVTPEWVSPLLPSMFDGDTVNVFALLRSTKMSANMGKPQGELRLLGKRAENEATQEISRVAFAGELESTDTLSRMAASVRFHATGGDVPSGRAPATASETLRLALAYQLLTDKTNFLLVHERLNGEKASGVPALQKVDQMFPAGWGGTGSVVPPCCDAILDKIRASGWSSAEALPALAVSVVPPSGRRFIGKVRRPFEHYSGLTPLEVSEWLRTTPAPEWPATYTELRQMGFSAWVLDWLEFSMAYHGGSSRAESKVVETFLYLMSRRETYDSLIKSRGVFANEVGNEFASEFANAFANTPAADTIKKPASVDVSLLEAMAAVLKGMTASTWPDQMLVLSRAADEVIQGASHNESLA
jgi:Ca-activated chloride channel family protein